MPIDVQTDIEHDQPRAVVAAYAGDAPTRTRDAQSP
jgi:hypothetical protein